MKHIQLSWKFHFSHHPLCDNYRDSVYHIGPLIVCQGCFLTTMGIITGFISSLMINLSLEPIQWSLMVLIIMSFLLIIEAFQITNRNIKRMTRITTGLGIGAFFWGLFTVDFPYKLVGLTVAMISYILFRIIRWLRPTTDLCIGCEELNAGKVCSGLEHKAKAMNDYSDYASDLLQDVLRSKFRNELKE